VIGHLCVGLWIIFARFPRLSQPRRDVLVQAWALKMLGCLSLKLIVKGTPPATGPILLVANHISWADIVVMHAARHCRFISKADVKQWPIVGTLATAAGTVYIERESRRDAMRVVHQMADYLKQNEVLAVFPEGTTGDGTHLLPFHGNMLQAAISAHAPVQPVALSFVDEATGMLSLAPCFVGDDSLVRSLWRTLCADAVTAMVEFGEPEFAEGRDRRVWAVDLRNTIVDLRGV